MSKEVQLWATLPENSKRNILLAINKETKLPTDAVEKDWWVVQTLRLIFDMDCTDNLRNAHKFGSPSILVKDYIFYKISDT